MDRSLIRLFEVARLPRYTSYPTAVQFTPAVGAAEHDAWLREVPPASEISLYLHVPYCREICWYCGCTTRALGKPGRAGAYAELLVQELRLVGDRLPAAVRVSHLHWGGGTPTILNRDLLRVMMAIRERMSLMPGAEVAIEVDPRMFSRETAEILAEAGISRASLGVQSFDAAVQKAINRLQGFEQTAAAVEALREVGVGGINIDLLYGLPHQTVASAVDTARQAAALRPDRLSVFGYAHLPAMRPHQRLIDETALPSAAERVDQFLAISHLLEGQGYSAVGLDHFALPQDGMAAAARKGSLRRNFQGYTTDAAEVLVGLGCSSISAFPQGYVQATADLVSWRKLIERGRLPSCRGVVLTAEDRARRAAIEAVMCQGRVDPTAVAARLGVAPELAAPDARRVDELAELGVIERRAGEIVMTPGHRPLLRLLAAAFDRYLAPGTARHAPAM